MTTMLTSYMSLTPVIQVLKGAPKGNDIAAIYPDGFQLSYWDLWFMVVIQHRFQSDPQGLEAYFIDKILNERFRGLYRREQVEDFLAHLCNLRNRLQGKPSIDAFLTSIPEKLVKKETQKGIKNVYDGDGAGLYPLSAAMLSSPRRQLHKDAMRGEWRNLPVDPGSIADKLYIVYQPPGHYFEKKQMSGLWRRLEKAVQKQLASSTPLFHKGAHEYAVYRAAATLYHEEHNNWHDSYGIMNDLLQSWITKMLEFTRETIGAHPKAFLKDLLLFLCWSEYACVEETRFKEYFEKLSTDENEIAKAILREAHLKAKHAFQDYKVERIARVAKTVWPTWSGILSLVALPGSPKPIPTHP